MEKDIEVNNISSLEYAFIGDAVFTFFIRKTLLKKYTSKLKIDNISKKCSNYISAKFQAYLIDYLIDDNILNDKEIDIYKLGRNQHSKSRAKNTTIVNYRKATGFETLIGYLYLNNEIDRLKYLSKRIELKLDDDIEI